MANEKLKEARDWINLAATLLSVLIIPIGLLVLRNQRLEMREENRREYVAIEVYKAEVAKRDAEITVISAKLDRLQISVTRLTDAVKLSGNAP